LTPAGIPGQPCGSFAGKIAAIVQTIEIICAGATISLVTTTTEAVSVVITTTTEAVSVVTTTTSTIAGCD